MDLEMGVRRNEKLATGNELVKLLADTYTLYLKTQNFHWNVTGPMFQTLHSMFEKQYLEMSVAVDQVAERIRALGLRAPGTFSQYARLSSITESENYPDSFEMIRQLIIGHETIKKTALDVLDRAEEGRDEVTGDLVGQRLEFHDRCLWMLRSFQEQ